MKISEMCALEPAAGFCCTFELVRLAPLKDNKQRMALRLKTLVGVLNAFIRFGVLKRIM